MKFSAKSEKNLKRYSAMVIAATAAGQTSAQISYTDINPDIVISDSSVYFDLNEDLQNDFVFLDTNYTGYNLWIAAATPLDSFKAFAGNVTSYEYPFKLTLGTMIDDALTWVPQNGSSVFGSLAFNQSSGFPYSGSFWANDASDGYLPLKVNIGGFDYFGWVRLSVAANTQSITIRDYAYEQSPNTGIPAGSTGLGINDSENKLETVFNVNNNELTITTKSKEMLYVSLFDLKGAELHSFHTSVSGKFILPEMENGIYIVRISSVNGSLSKRFSFTK